VNDDKPETRPAPDGKCPRCDDALPEPATGRPPKWCSQRCRRAAYEERRAAASGAIAIEFLQPVVQADEHDLSECVRRAICSPAACRRVVHALTELATSGELRRDPKWQSTLTAIHALTDALTTRRYDPSRSRFSR
jgi:hypothetical protein